MNRSPIILEDLERISGSLTDVHEELRGSTILITGANGFIPAYLVDTFLFLNDTQGLNIEQLLLVRNETKAWQRFSTDLERSKIRLIVQDATQPIEWPGKIDYIIHAASQASPKYFGSDPVGTLAPNTVGTFQLLELAQRKNSRSFLFFSSAEVYGLTYSVEMPLKEDNFGPLDPSCVRSCYGESKRMGETMCISWAHQYGTPTKIVRPFHVYGPKMALDDGRVFCDFVNNVLRGENIAIKSDGTARRAYCYLADATIAFLRVLLRGKNATPYNVGNPSAEASVLELAQMLAGLCPEKNLVITTAPLSLDYLASSVQRIVPDVTRINDLGWKPETPIVEGFSRTLRSYDAR